MKRLLLCGASVVALLAQAGGAQAAAELAGAEESGTQTAGAETTGIAKQLRALIETAQHDPQFKPGSDQQKIADFYASYMDLQRLEQLGYRPLIGELQRIRVLRDRRGLPQVIAHLSQIGVQLPYAIQVAPAATVTAAGNAGTSTSTDTYAAHLIAGKLGMPNLAAYAPKDDQGLQAVRAKYLLHIEKVLALAGARDAGTSALAALSLETQLAALQLESKSQVGAATVTIDKLATIAPGYDWASALGAAAVLTKTDSLVIAHPGYLAGFAKLAHEAELASWKAYLEWQLLRSYSPYLSRAFAGANALFYGTPPVGEPDQRPRWQAGVELVSTVLADQVGKLYVARHFPPERKARFERLAAGQLAACGASATTSEAKAAGTGTKGSALRAKVGYPAKWHNASSLMVSPSELAGNIMRARQLDTARQVARLSTSVDRDEWTSAPHDARIFYDPLRHAIVLPAAALQAPLVDEQADDNAVAAALAARIRQACAGTVAR